MKIKIAPAILDCDLTRLGEQIRIVEQAGADLLHVDVMDGHFVPNLTGSPRIVRAIRRAATIPVDVHLMLTDPLRYAPDFVEAGADIVLFHIEAVSDPWPVVERIKAEGAQVGIALRPDTPADAVAAYAGALDCLMAMTVVPGFSGQAFMESGAAKIPRLRELFGDEIDIYVDGGIGPDTVPVAVRHGANVLAAASAVFGQGKNAPEKISELRKIAESAAGSAP